MKLLQLSQRSPEQSIELVGKLFAFCIRMVAREGRPLLGIDYGFRLLSLEPHCELRYIYNTASQAASVVSHQFDHASTA